MNPSSSLSILSLVPLLSEPSFFFPHNKTPPLLVYINNHDDAVVDSRFCCTYKSLVERGDSDFKWVRPKSELDPIVLNYTSGTTTASKGVKPQRNFHGDDRCFDRLGCSETIAARNPVKTLTARAPPPTAVLLRTESLGFVVSHGYRLTETGGLVVFCAWKRDWNKLSATEQARLKSRQSLGLTEADVVDPESGLNVKHDESTLGEIVLKGASVMLGYLKDPIATNKCMKKTGDFTPVMLVSCTPMGRGGHG
ncbi:hypothetical protein V6N11_009522 [Hibiscus sabdariffa]|uniref:AMP-dependent synthetase/ligase domain-containing protein n=1 Tax=Hibiscus sabdariffa TaxID=183260 RepID=A0ABR2P5X8_9ROSI